MKTKQSVKLKYASPLYLISEGIRYSHDNHDKSDTKIIGVCPRCKQDSDIEYLDQEYKCHSCGEVFSMPLKVKVLGDKDYDLIKRIGFHMNHASVLEHSIIVFDVKMTTKALLEESRHRIGVSQTVTSSRYALDKIEIEFEPNDDHTIECFLKHYRNQVLSLLEQYRDSDGKIKKKDMDNLAEVLPQAFIYKMQITFNLRSLTHFLELRLSKSAHRDIRIIAYLMMRELPDDYRNLLLENPTINKYYKQCQKDFESSES